MRFPVQVFQRADVGILIDDQDPAARIIRGLGIHQIADHFHLGAGFFDPVLPGQSGINGAVGDINAHFLGAHQRATNLGVVDGGKIVARAGGDIPAGLGKQLPGSHFQTAFGDA